jgi:Flp pilus assembly protein protease CpaA
MLLWAAIVDIRTRRIANRLNLAIALMAPCSGGRRGSTVADAAIRVGVAMSVYLCSLWLSRWA